MRMFIGVDVEADLKHRIAEAQERWKARCRVRWEPADKLHLTLKFLGEVADEQLPAVMDAAARVAAVTEEIEIEFGGAGVFPHLRRPRVLWLGVRDPAGGLARLAERLESAMADLGFAPEGRAFRSHLTIGRPAPDADLRSVVADLAGDQRLRMRQNVNSVVLYQSELRAGGSLYTRPAQYELTGQPNLGELS